MKYWVLAAAAVIPAVALATPITVTTASGKTVTAKVKQKDKDTSTTPAAPATPAASDRSGLGNALASDVTLGGISASSLVYGAGINPQQGPNGNTSGFAGAYAASGTGDWASLAKFSGASTPGSINAALSGLTLTMGFGLSDSRHGTWSITNTSQDNNLSLDLVFAMHTGGGSGSWLFDNYVLGAGSTAQGSWSLNLLNNGGQLADYSNLTLFARNAVATPFVPAPAAAGPSAPAAGTPAPAAETAPAAGGVVVQIPIGELLDELAKHGPIEAGTEIEFGGLFGDPVSAEVPEPAALAVFLAGLAMFGANMGLRKRRPAAAA